MMNKYIKQIDCADYQALSEQAAQFTAGLLKAKPDARLGLPTGGTPTGMYKRLKSMDLDFSKCHTFNLDEYIGLPAADERSYRFFMQSRLFNHINLPAENIHFLNGAAKEPEKECERYDGELYRHGPLSLQILGMGFNGHIGFNEPSEQFVPQTHLVQLSQETIRANARFFANAGQVPKQAITMGIASILQAKKILLLAGEGKGEILRQALTGPVTPWIPASVLQLHPDVTVVTTSDVF